MLQKDYFLVDAWRIVEEVVVVHTFLRLYSATVLNSFDVAEVK